MTLQLFVWVGHGEVEDNRINYKSFTLNDHTYHVGDCVYLYPEDEQFPPYIARILAAFVDRNVQAGADPHCIEVKWFERRVNLEPSTKGIEESEREVFELEDTDINPIGCISGKCRIVKAPTYEEASEPGRDLSAYKLCAYGRCGNAPGWFFCRGYFHQSSNSFVAYAPDEMDDWLVTNEQQLNVTTQRQRPLGFGHAFPHGHQQQQPQQQHGRGPGSAGSQPQSGSDVSARGTLQGPSAPHDQAPPAIPNSAGVVATDVDDVDQELEDLGPPPQRRPAQQQQQPPSKRQKVTGRTCVECGATSTPQWREGPMGPKTLCNACGVRYVRSQQKAAGQKRGGGPKNGQGRSQEPTPPRAQQQQQQADRVTKQGKSQKNFTMSGPSQVEFFFSGPPLTADSGVGARTDYAGFNLNGVEYKLGDCAYLYPEDEDVPPYVGRILACFHDQSGRAADPHCVEVAWYERRAHLEPDFQGGNWEHEVVALEETDINPIGCISGKAVVFTAGDYEEARQMAITMDVDDWLFCRGVYKQCDSSFVPFLELAGRMEAMDGKWNGKRGPAGMLGHWEGVADSDEVKRQRVVEEQPAASVRRSGKLVSGRTCVECGATQTPQWREGPAGPKTLCNACGVRYVRAQQRANKRSATSGGVRCGYGSGGRQSRTSKVAKAEAASARAARAIAANAAEEASHRPQRQAALMAASKTALYARTGVFPMSSVNLQLQHISANCHDTAIQELQQQPQQHQQHDADACGIDGAFGKPPVAAGANAVVRLETPNCSSYDSCGSLQEGMTVEVVVGPVDGDAECCGGSGAGIAAAAAAAGPTYPSAVAAPLPSPSSEFPGDSGVMLQSVESIMTVAPVLAQLGTDQLQGQQVPTVHTSADAAAAAGVLRASSGFIMGSEPASGDMFFAIARDCRLGGHTECFPAGTEQVCLQPAVECDPPTLSGSCGGVAVADCIPDDCAPLKGCTALDVVVSAPVSPSVEGDGSGGFNFSDYVGDRLLDSELRGYGSQLDCGLAAGLDDEYGPLVEVEVDFGLGPASAIADGSLFGEFNHSPCDDDDNDIQPRPHLQTQLHNQQQERHNVDSDECVFDATDLPAVAARVAAFCPDLAPGTDARELLNSMPMLAQVAVTPHGACSRMPAGEMPAAPASAATTNEDSALPEDAVAHLVMLGRQASRAATEAMAADVAFQAVSQVLEAHQEAARKAREAAVANLGHLKNCISTLSGGDPLAVADMSGHLIDTGASSGLGSILGACCCSLDAADLVVAVHS